MIFRALSLLAFFIGAAAPAQAHKPSDAYLSLTADNAAIDVRWDIALRDLDYAIGLDGDGDGVITWGETRARREAITAYARARLDIAADGAACPLDVSELLIDRHSDGAYAVLTGAAACPARPVRLDLGYRLFSDIDPQHKGLLRLVSGARTQTAIFSPEAARQSFALAETPLLKQFSAYFLSGVEHIWTGYDHILFLLSLLLPAAAIRVGRQWLPQASLRVAFLDVAKIVTAFTLAHSITLALATLQFVQPPSRLVESAIALSVIVAALNNVYPLIRDNRWAVAGCFGLLHGFGFASALIDLGLPRAAMALALVGFNIGVEAGQLAIVALFLPIAWRLRDGWIYRHAMIGGGSVAIAVVASVWFVERAFDISLMR